MGKASHDDGHDAAGDGGKHVGDAHEDSGVIAGNVDMIGQDAGEDGAKGAGGDNQQDDHHSGVTARQANSNQASTRYDRG